MRRLKRSTCDVLIAWIMGAASCCGMRAYENGMSMRRPIANGSLRAWPARRLNSVIGSKPCRPLAPKLSTARPCGGSGLRPCSHNTKKRACDGRGPSVGRGSVLHSGCYQS